MNILNTKKEIPIFFSCDETYLPYLSVSLQSLIKNALSDANYNIFILTNNISKEGKEKIYSLQRKNISISFISLKDKIKGISKKLDDVRDYYNQTIFYRLFIASLFPHLKKAIYLDCDIVVLSDIAKFYDLPIGNNILGAITDGVVRGNEEFKYYVQKTIGIDPDKYFNSGVLLMNLSAYREAKIEEKFVYLLDTYKFIALAPDQDYLNYLCKDRIYYISESWNRMPIKEDGYNSSLNLIHYNMFMKPWHYSGVLYEDYFWKYATETVFYNQIFEEFKSYSEAQKASDLSGVSRMVEMMHKIIASNHYFAYLLPDEKLKALSTPKVDVKKAQDRIEVLEKIENYEKEGGDSFFKDVENDPPHQILMPGDVDYLNKKYINRFKHFFAYRLGNYIRRKAKKMYKIKVEGIEKVKGLKGGAIITSNHFAHFESACVSCVVKKIRRGAKLYIVIREGNYTMPGIFGFLFRYCDTLPLSSNFRTMKNFNDALSKVLKRKKFVLVYPEQSMWWNYRKPRPQRTGAAHFAVKNNVPIIPCFVTMKDSNEVGKDGFPLQEYTIHVMDPIYPDPNKSIKMNVEEMTNKNYELCKAKYEEVYGEQVTYTCDETHE